MKLIQSILFVTALLLGGCKSAMQGHGLDEIKNPNVTAIMRSNVVYEFENNHLLFPLDATISSVFREYGINPKNESSSDPSYLLTLDFEHQISGGKLGFSAYYVNFWITVLTLGIIPSYYGDIYTVNTTLTQRGVVVYNQTYMEKVHNIIGILGASSSESSNWPDNTIRQVGDKIANHILIDIDRLLKKIEPKS